MMKKEIIIMTIREFIELYEKEDKYLNEIISIKRYLSTHDKLRLAESVIEESAEYDRFYVKFDTYKKYLAFVFSVIEAHTDLKFSVSWDEKIAEYDVLCEKQLLNYIISNFKDSYEECWSVLNMKCSDLLADNSVEANIAKIAQSVTENLDVFTGTLSDKLAEIDLKKIIPENMDLNKLQWFLDKFK